MSKNLTESVANIQEREESQLRQVRNAIVGYYANTALDVFKKYVEINDVELAEFLRITEDATIVYTMPTEESLAEDEKRDEKRFKKGHKFGTEQWYKKTQVVASANNVLTSYTAYLRYLDSKDKAEERLNKKLDTTETAFESMTREQQLAYIERLTAKMK